MRSLARLGGGVLVLAGYLLVSAGQQIEFWSLGGSLDPKGMFTLEFATTASYVIFGVAWFVHLRVIIPRPGNAGHVRWTMWLFAIASALLAVGWVAEIRDLVGGPHGYSSLPTETIVGLALTAFGFAVVFVGFFWAGKSIGIGEAETVPAEPDNPSNDTASVPAQYEQV